ncbi:MAG: two-component system, OmpR family, sensor kinase [Chloroflexota bacterium]|nr:two-component system, OmpR family, sensor kinase [Chloroflexota bacterium]
MISAGTGAAGLSVRQEAKQRSPRRAPLTTPGSALAVMMLVLLGALLADYAAPLPFVMTPLYAVPVLIAARVFTPAQVAVVGIIAILVNVVAALAQGTPLAVGLLYDVGLALTTALAVMLAQQRRVAARHAEEADAARAKLERFVGMVAHDLKSPLTVLAGYTQHLQRGWSTASPEAVERGLASIESATARMRRLTDDLHDTTRLLSGQFEVQPVAMDLVPLTRQLLEQPDGAASTPRLLLDAPEQMMGRWDPERIAQLLTNLLSNAVKYASEGAEVRVGIEPMPYLVRLSVADQGPGIPEDRLSELFQPFSRLDRASRIAGTGLGLYIAKGIAEAHGGCITVASTPGHGATFVVELPYEPPPTA